jgi:NAD-dependent DNA ligase
MSGFRDKELMEKIISEGGILVNTILKNTYILIINDDSVSDASKVTKVKELKIKIYTKEEFEKIL